MIRGGGISDPESPLVKEYNSVLEHLIDRGLSDGLEPNDMEISDELISPRYLKFIDDLIKKARSKDKQ
jgi:hypothetical protein